MTGRPTPQSFQGEGFNLLGAYRERVIRFMAGINLPQPIIISTGAMGGWPSQPNVSILTEVSRQRGERDRWSIQWLDEGGIAYNDTVNWYFVGTEIHFQIQTSEMGSL